VPKKKQLAGNTRQNKQARCCTAKYNKTKFSFANWISSSNKTATISFAAMQMTDNERNYS
jgi:hypothetical protein